MNPPPPRLPACGCVTASAKATATAASTALPPRCSASSPMCVARFSWLTTIAWWATIACAGGNGVSARAAGSSARKARTKVAHAPKARRSGRGRRPRPGIHENLRLRWAPVFMGSRFRGNDGEVSAPNNSRLDLCARPRLAVIDAVRPHVGRGRDPVRHVEEAGDRRNVPDVAVGKFGLAKAFAVRFRDLPGLGGQLFGEIEHGAL